MYRDILRRVARLIASLARQQGRAPTCFIGVTRVHCSPTDSTAHVASHATHLSFWRCLRHHVEMQDYLEVNRANWDERLQHMQPRPTMPSSVSSPILPFCPRLSASTISARRARGVEESISAHRHRHGFASAPRRSDDRLDFSPASLTEARSLAQGPGRRSSLSRPTCTVPSMCFERASFDLVYTGIRSPRLVARHRAVGRVVAGLLRPSGRLFIRECHPMLFAIRRVPSRPSRR